MTSSIKKFIRQIRNDLRPRYTHTQSPPADTTPEEHAFATALGAITCPAPTLGTLLAPAMGGHASTLLLGVVLKPYALAGYDIRVTNIQTTAQLDLIHAMGFAEGHDIRNYRPSTDHGLAAKWMRDVTTISDVMAINHHDVRCGKYALSSALMASKKASFDMADPDDRAYIQNALAGSIMDIEGACAVMADAEPAAMLLIDHGYLPSGAYYDLCLHHQIPVFSWNASHRNGSLMLKRYNATNIDTHPYSLSSKSWQILTENDWSDTTNDAVMAEITDCYMSGNWFAEVGTQKDDLQRDHQAIRDLLAFKQDQKLAVIFPHILWDGTFFWGNDLFDSYEHWLEETVRAAIANPHLNWVIKVHPAHIVKNARSGITDDPAELAVIQRVTSELPANVRCLMPDSPISSWALLNLLDYCVTVRGTVGIEAALLGKRVITAGTGRYDHLGFTTDPESREAYLTLIADLHTLTPLPEADRQLAIRFAYGVFLCRPSPLQSVGFGYGRDRMAQMDLTMKMLPGTTTPPADLMMIADWIRSGDLDFFRDPASVVDAGGA